MLGICYFYIVMEPKLRELLFILMNGLPKECKEAKRDIEKLWENDHTEFQKNAVVVLEYIEQFDQIKNHENQAAFASGLNLFFLVLGDDYFNELKNFVIKVIQHPNGQVREAIRKTADWLYCSLTDRVDPFIYQDQKQSSEKLEKNKKEAEKQFREYVLEIEALIEKYDDGLDESEYIDEMKPSIHKSLQTLWADVTRGNTWAKLNQKPVTLEIFTRRMAIKDQLNKLLKDADSDYSDEDVIDAIYYETNSKDFTDIIAMFDNGQDAVELENVLETINDAWNYFPHKILDGFSPAEKVSEYQKN